MTSYQLLFRNLRHYWRNHLAVLGCIAITTAVLTGALLVGDSMRGSLLQLAFDRIGNTDYVVQSKSLFRSSLANKIEQNTSIRSRIKRAVPILLVRGSLQSESTQGVRRVNKVNLIGCDHRFKSIDHDANSWDIPKDRILLNSRTAKELGVVIGDEIILRVSTFTDLPADTLLGNRDSLTTSHRLVVEKIIATKGIGRFSLHADQQDSLNAMVNLETLQEILDIGPRVNVLLMTQVEGTQNDLDNPTVELLKEHIPFSLADYNLNLEKIDRQYANQKSYSYWNLTSTEMMLPDAIVEQLKTKLDSKKIQPIFTYLANSIEANGHQLPYSTISGVDSTDELGPFFKEDQKNGTATENKPKTDETIWSPADNEIVLNSWAAEDLKVQTGDEVKVRYYLPESTHGKLQEPPAVLFRVRAALPLTYKNGIPTAIADKKFAPRLKGVTDEKKIRDWDLPFPLDEQRHGKIRDKDEDYWDQYRAMPKAFISQATADRLWQSRFGSTTSIRISTEHIPTKPELLNLLKIDPTKVGISILPLREELKRASQGTTPFGLLFIGFSFFVLIASLLLTSMMFKLSLERRSSEIGILRASGWTSKQLQRLYLSETFLIALSGGFVGVLFAFGYAEAMIWCLNHFWREAISTSFLRFHFTLTSIAIGLLSSLFVSLITIRFGLRQLISSPILQIIKGSTDSIQSVSINHWSGSLLIRISLICWLGSVIAAFFFTSGEAQAGLFFASGGLSLLAIILIFSKMLHNGLLVQASHTSEFTSTDLVLRNITRNPSRSLLSISLIAIAIFIILSLSAFRLSPSSYRSGHFEIIAESDHPMINNLNTAEGRFDAGFNEEDNLLAESFEFHALRVHEGDHASCLNLYQARQPRILGVSNSFMKRGGFEFAGTISQNPQEISSNQVNQTKNNLGKNHAAWLILDKSSDDHTIPAMLDANTATYSLKVGIGDTLAVEDQQGRKVLLRIVGLLKNSIFQGDLLLSEKNFLKLYPSTSGYRMFLIDIDPKTSSENTNLTVSNLPEVIGIYESNLSDFGFDAIRSSDRLKQLMQVQNTYITAFQSLGLLGLVLGTFGLAAVQIRNVIDRRKELAMLKTLGFFNAQVAQLILKESMLLLTLGLLIGVIAASGVVFPHWLLGGATIPWQSILIMVLIIFVSSTAASMVAIRCASRFSIIASLRDE